MTADEAQKLYELALAVVQHVNVEFIDRPLTGYFKQTVMRAELNMPNITYVWHSDHGDSDYIVAELGKLKVFLEGLKP